MTSSIPYPISQPTLRAQRIMWIILGAAFIIRLVQSASADPMRVIADDTAWYVNTGIRLLTHSLTPENLTPFPPLYALFTGSAHLLLNDTLAVPFLLIVQAGLATLTCAFVWRITYRLTGDTRTALVAAAGMAFNPISVLDNSILVSETLFLFLLVWGISVYVGHSQKPHIALAATAGLLGLTTLTRAVTILYPVGLVIHLFLIHPWRRALGYTAVLMVCYGAVIGSWTLYNAVVFNRIIIGGYGINDMLLTAAVGYSSSSAVDPTYAEFNDGKVPTGAERDDVALRVVGSIITQDPIGYGVRRIAALGETLLQPHQTTYYPGRSLKDALVNWLQNQRTIAGLVEIVSDPTFFPKFVLYIAHWSALLFGVLGIVLTLRRWRQFAPLSGWIVYIMLIHLVLLALPRYVYPITPALWVFAGIGIVYITRHWLGAPHGVVN
jgi:4-amino-4-deoxy-L-arabinose transferase-like glycosyltransferase